MRDGVSCRSSANQRIHVLEESRHMKFAREGYVICQGISRAAVSSAPHIAGARTSSSPASCSGRPSPTPASRCRPRDEGDEEQSHFQSMIRSSCVHLVEFLDEVGLLTKPARCTGTGKRICSDVCYHPVVLQ